MKKHLIIILCGLTGLGAAQQDKSWSFGLQWGFHGNGSEYSGGMENADARFQKNTFGGISLGLLARYDYNRRWMFTTGLGIYSYGFTFALANNYSLRNEAGRFSVLGNEYGLLELPTMAYYKLNPNCENKKWLIGLGIVRALCGASTNSRYYTGDPEANPGADYLKVSSSSNNTIGRMIRLDIALERVLKRGGILQVGLVLNAGLKPLATADVTYQIEGRQYNHTFVNNGSSIGLRASYFLRPLKAKR